MPANIFGFPYYECHKCGWFETCPYPQRYPTNPNRARDIQCGIAVQALHNCLRAWWPRLLEFRPDDAWADFIDALFHFVQFVLDAHLGMGTLINNWNPEWWGPEMAAHLTATPFYLRPYLDHFAFYFQRLPFDSSKFQVVFVEGEAVHFLQRLQDRRFLSFVARIEVLGGKPKCYPRTSAAQPSSWSRLDSFCPD